MGALRICTVCTICTLVALAGCQTVKGSFCTISSPIRVSQPVIDAMSDAEVRDVLAHNVKGEKLCGWKQ